MFEGIKYILMKAAYKKLYGKDWKKYFLNPFRTHPDYMPIQFDGDELEQAEKWEEIVEDNR